MTTALSKRSAKSDPAFGARLRETRISLGLTEQQAAKEANRSVETWRKYEATGSGRMTGPLLLFVKAHKGKFSLNWLFTGEA